MKRRVALFAEDNFHERFLRTLLERMAVEAAIEIEIEARSVSGGLPKVVEQFEAYVKDLRKQSATMPDLIVVATDSNCVGHTERKRMVVAVAARFPPIERLLICAIPEPHIERWMLADPNAFAEVFGRGCTAPTVKCKKDEYKHLLVNEIRKSGIEAPLGGREFAEDIVLKLDLTRVAQNEASFGLLHSALRAKFQQWQQQRR